jgi:3-dehydroquinate synthase
VVSRDETEQGERMLLNLGHTFGHAIETEQGYGGYLHGEAISIGMCLAAKLSAQMKRAPVADAERLIALLKRTGLPTGLPPELDGEALLNRMKLDKKALSGSLRLILWRGLGRADVVADVPESAILRVLNG